MPTELLTQAAAVLSAPLAGLGALLAVRLRRAARAGAAREGRCAANSPSWSSAAPSWRTARPVIR